MNNRITVLIATASLGILAPVATFAQGTEGTLMLPTDVTIRDIGWRQIANTDEIVQFFLAVAETLVFVALLAFHPRANALRNDAERSRVQVSLFLFGLIGMVVGFLVVHHGYLIGFVIFGLGSLFRFRMESSSLIDGAILIIVTLVGLAVGLDLPVMALIATLACAATLWFAVGRRSTVLVLKYADEETLAAALEPIQHSLAAKGLRIASIRKNDFKPVVEFVLSHGEGETVKRVPELLDDLGRAGHGAKGWHLA